MSTPALELVRAATEPQSRSETDPVQTMRTKFFQACIATANTFHVDGSAVAQMLKQDFTAGINNHPFPLRIRFPDLHTQFTLYDTGIVAITLMENMVGRISLRRRSVIDTAQFFIQVIKASEKLRQAVVEAAQAIAVAEKAAGTELKALGLSSIQAQRTFSQLMDRSRPSQVVREYRND